VGISSTCAPGAAGGYSYLITKLSANYRQTIGKLSANPAPGLAVVLVRLCVCSASRPLFLRLFARSPRPSLAPVCPPVGATTAAQMEIFDNDDDMFAERAAQEAQAKAKVREREAQAIYNEQERYNSMPSNQFQCVTASPCPCPCHLPPAYSSPLAPRSSLLTPQSTRVSVCRRGCPLRMKDLVKRTHGRENGKVVGLPTITDSLGFSDQKKDCAWVRWEGGSSEWVPWNELTPIRRSPSRAKRPVEGCFRPGHSPSSSKKRSFVQPTLFSQKGRRAAWKVQYPATPPPLPHAARTSLLDSVSFTVADLLG
jgi:hypothetical protein